MEVCVDYIYTVYIIMCTSFINGASNIIQYDTQWQNDYWFRKDFDGSSHGFNWGTLQHLCQGTRKEAMKNLRKDDQCPSQYMNHSLPTYNSEVL